MSPIEWDQSFSVGHAMVDSQHEQFLILFNKMEQSFQADSGIQCQNHRLNILRNLLEFTEKHFRLEKKLMQEYGYSDAYNHWRSHKNFDVSIYTIYRKTLAGELVSDLSIYMLLRDKFRKHILEEDKLMFQRFFSSRPPRELLKPEFSLALSGDHFSPIFQP
jgi:hemerythrin